MSSKFGELKWPEDVEDDIFENLYDDIFKLWRKKSIQNCNPKKIHSIIFKARWSNRKQKNVSMKKDHSGKAVLELPSYIGTRWRSVCHWVDDSCHGRTIYQIYFYDSWLYKMWKIIFFYVNKKEIYCDSDVNTSSYIGFCYSALFIAQFVRSVCIFSLRIVFLMFSLSNIATSLNHEGI